MAVPKIRLADGKMVFLGRIRPKEIKDAGNLLSVTTKEGKEILVAKLGPHFHPEQLESQPPNVVDLAAKAARSVGRMYLNDRYGDCVIASKYHAMGTMSANDKGPEVEGTDQEVEQSYHRICGPGDNGCVITEVMDAWKNQGLPASGRTDKIDAYVAVDWTDKLMVQTAIYIFGNLTLGIDLPQAWTCGGCKWDITPTRIVGGHDVQCIGYNDEGVQIATWGKICTITWPAFISRRWLSEAYVALGPDWYGIDGIGGSGIDIETLKADLAAIGGGHTPPVPDPTPPPTPLPPNPPPVPPPTPGPFPSPFILLLIAIVKELQSIPNLPPALQKMLAWALIMLELLGVKREEIGR